MFIQEGQPASSGGSFSMRCCTADDANASMMRPK
jgi:hypothetical protein